MGLEADVVRRMSETAPSMHGRRVIYTSEKEITRENVLDVLSKALAVHRANREEEIYLEKYIRGVQPILDRVKTVNAEINNKIVVNIANEIVTFKTSEFAGEPIQYISRGSADNEDVPEKVAQINDMMLSEGKQTKDLELAHDMFSFGVGYRLVVHDRGRNTADYLDEAPFEIYIPEPFNTFVVRLNDVTKRVVMGVTYVYKDPPKSDVEYTVYTDNVTYTVTGTGDKLEITDEVHHNFGMVTLIEYPCNPLRMSPIDIVHDLLNSYNLCISNRLDGVEQFIQAIMVFEGVDITREQFLELKDLGALKLPPSMDGRTSRVYYLNEQLDQAQTQTLVDNMHDLILQIVGMPSQGNANVADSSNNGATIMKNGWWHAEARALETQAMWKEAETQLLKIVLKICKDSNVLSGLKISDLEPKFWRQSYEDLLVKTQSFSTLRAAGMPASQAFAFSHLSKDPESDAMIFDAYQEEQAAALDALSGVGSGASGGSETEFSADEEGSSGKEESFNASRAHTGGATGSGHPRNRTATCPVCHRTFQKKTNNQVYDRPECRAKAGRGGESGAVSE